jgi:6-phosphogluconolactonase
MTLTFAGIARARLVLFTVAGDGKSDAFQRLRAGDTDLPAARVTADHVVWIVDHAAADG